ncbi:MAG: hypothetical protein V3V99_12215 [candidate division Zixibacteria bacterium]
MQKMAPILLNYTPITTGDIVNDGGTSNGISLVNYDNDGDSLLEIENDA